MPATASSLDAAHNHARTRIDMHRYKVEPYVVAADVYAAPGHVGRGGWSSSYFYKRCCLFSFFSTLSFDRVGLRLNVGQMACSLL